MTEKKMKIKSKYSKFTTTNKLLAITHQLKIKLMKSLKVRH